MKGINMQRGFLFFIVSGMILLKNDFIFGQIILRDSVEIGKINTGEVIRGFKKESMDTSYGIINCQLYSGVAHFAFIVLPSKARIKVNVTAINNSYPCWWVMAYPPVEGYDDCTTSEEYFCAGYSYYGVDKKSFSSPLLQAHTKLRFVSYYCYDWDFTLPIIIKEDSLKYLISWDYVSVEVLIEKQKYQVTFDTTEIRHLDSAKIFVQEKDNNNNNVTPPSGTMVKFSLDANGQQFGSLRLLDSTRVEPGMEIPYSTANSGGVMYVADGAMPDSLCKVGIKVVNSSDSTKDGSGLIDIQPDTLHKILLGQTRYYWAKNDPNDDTKLIIEETDAMSSGLGGYTYDIWHNSPLTILNVANQNNGRRLGAYWETGKRQPNGQQLQSGMIRLIGRYWHSDSTYCMQLTANNGNRQGSIDILVEKPDRLGNSTFARDRDNGIDVEGHPYSVDSLCIFWGGKYGFPPQNIKAQFQSESVWVDRLNAYVPAYRYEPWTVEFWPGTQDMHRTSHFWTSFPSSMGDGDPVPHHNNTQYMDYAYTPQSVWYFIEQYSTIVHTTAPSGDPPLFGSRSSNGRLVFPIGNSGDVYIWPTGEYDNIRRQTYRKLRINIDNDNTVANDSTRLRFIKYMSRGLQNRAAQSRIASSYGPMQLLYTTAILRRMGYEADRDNTPEALNELNIFFPFAMKFYLRSLENQVNGQLNSSNNWQEGHYEIMRRIYQAWNNSTNYAIKILRNSVNYLPIKN